MKKLLLFTLLSLLTFNINAQIVFEKGYYILNSGERVNCLIKDYDRVNNPINIKWKINEAGEEKILSSASIREFGINNTKYISRKVNIDRSSDNTNNLTDTRSPIYTQERILLKVLLEGKGSLYYYKGKQISRFFFKIDDSEVKQLIFKSYLRSGNKIVKNEDFKQQLFNSLKCTDIERQEITGLQYNTKSLSKIFIKYNTCSNSESITYLKKREKAAFTLSIRPRLNLSSHLVSTSLAHGLESEIENKINPAIGIEAELFFPFNKNKWSFIIEPTYQYFSESRGGDINSPDGQFVSELSYHSIELPIGMRHYFFFNKDEKVFINAQYVLDFPFNSTIKLRRFNKAPIISEDIKSAPNFAFGAGYKFKNKYGVEVRYLTNRDLLRGNSIWLSEYNTLSFIVSYTLF